jgi:hypothetical protein
MWFLQTGILPQSSAQQKRSIAINLAAPLGAISNPVSIITDVARE